MKKIIFIIAVFAFLNIFFKAFAQDNTYLKKEQVAQGFYKVQDAESKKWKIIDSENKVILDGEFDKVFVLKIDDTKGDEIDNLIFIGLFDTRYPLAHIYIPKYPADNFFENFYKRHNEISNVKFYDYPKHATLIIKRKNKYGYLNTRDGKYVFALPRYTRIRTPYGSTDYYKNQDTDTSSNIFKVLGITFGGGTYMDLKTSFLDDNFHINDETGYVFGYSNYADNDARKLYEDCKVEGKTIIFTYSKNPTNNSCKIYKNNDKFTLKDKTGKVLISEIEILNEEILDKISDKINEKNLQDIMKLSNDEKYSTQDTLFNISLPVLVPLYVASYVPAYALSVPGFFLLPVTWPFAFMAANGDHPYIKAFFWYAM